tara:strand:+ start:469 stop:678 length:210 start_codon:yes stop_codon:yes gene_type:complete
MPNSGSDAKPELKVEKTYLKNFDDVSSSVSRKIPEKNGLKNISTTLSENLKFFRYWKVVVSVQVSDAIS